MDDHGAGPAHDSEQAAFVHAFFCRRPGCRHPVHRDADRAADRDNLEQAPRQPEGPTDPDRDRRADVGDLGVGVREVRPLGGADRGDPGGADPAGVSGGPPSPDQVSGWRIENNRIADTPGVPLYFDNSGPAPHPGDDPVVEARPRPAASDPADDPDWDWGDRPDWDDTVSSGHVDRSAQTDGEAAGQTSPDEPPFRCSWAGRWIPGPDGTWIYRASAPHRPDLILWQEAGRWRSRIWTEADEPRDEPSSLWEHPDPDGPRTVWGPDGLRDRPPRTGQWGGGCREASEAAEAAAGRGEFPPGTFGVVGHTIQPGEIRYGQLEPTPLVFTADRVITVAAAGTPVERFACPRCARRAARAVRRRAFTDAAATAGWVVRGVAPAVADTARALGMVTAAGVAAARAEAAAHTASVRGWAARWLTRTPTDPTEQARRLAAQTRGWVERRTGRALTEAQRDGIGIWAEAFTRGHTHTGSGRDEDPSTPPQPAGSTRHGDTAADRAAGRWGDTPTTSGTLRPILRTGRDLCAAAAVRATDAARRLTRAAQGPGGRSPAEVHGEGNAGRSPHGR